MKIISFTLLCMAFAFASGIPWYYKSRAQHAHQESYFDSEGLYHRAKSMQHPLATAAKSMQRPLATAAKSMQHPLATTQQQAGQDLCKSASYKTNDLLTYVHVCESGEGSKEYCFITNGPCCILSSQSGEPVEQFLLTLNSQKRVTVSFYGASGTRGVCYTFDEANENLQVCTGCQRRECVETRCIQNTVTGSLDSCNSTTCQCKEGFAPDDCCECDLTGVNGRPHYTAPDGTCKPLCRDFCAVRPTESGCSRCQPGHKPPDCCECEEGYYKAEGGSCRRLCSAFCAVTPTDSGCAQCQTGYKEPDCCNCDPDYYKAENGTCKPLCSAFCAVTPTDSGCTRCETGYKAPSCCECDDGYYKADDGTCKPVCTRFCAGTPTASGCARCQTGYKEPSCCECDEGYYEAVDGTCQRVCRAFCAVTPTDSGCARCETGYKAPSCCECDDGYYKADDGTCKPLCRSFCASIPTQSGCARCQTGYKPPACCECDEGYYKAEDGTCKSPCSTGVDECKNGSCSCKPGYKEPDCCDCEPGFYKDSKDNTCKTPCTTGVHQCINNVCTCEPGYLQPDCCKCAPGYTEQPDGSCATECSAVQDVYLVVDATASNLREAFCQTNYGIELLITAMAPGSSTSSGTRLAAVFYPKVDTTTEPRVAHTFIDMGTGCTEAVGNYNTMIDGFYNEEFENRYRVYIRGLLTYPTPAIRRVTNMIQQSISAGEPANRRRIVIVLTDGNNDDDDSTDLKNTVQALKDISDSITVLAAGNNVAYRDDPELDARFRSELEIIAGPDNIVISRDGEDLAIGLVQKMIDIGAVCEERGKEIISRLEDGKSSLAHCYCIEARGPGHSVPAYQKQRCRNICNPLTPPDCRSPPTCSATLKFGAMIQGNPYYDSSDNVKVMSAHREEVKVEGARPPDKSGLEKDILAAVEEVLRERMEG